VTAGFSTVLLDALAGGLTVRFRAQGGSMYPTIRDGEVITVAPVPTATFNGGDVLLCRCGSRVLAHRVIAITRDDGREYFHLRGDAKGGCDAPVRAADIVGRVISVARRQRTIVLCGRIARLRRAARAMASRVNAIVRRQRYRLRDALCYPSPPFWA
jgi:signal peptidase I